MTASDATATIKKGVPEPGFDKTAQRILNLFFVLNSSPEPLTTEQIVLDSDLGYGSGNIDSDKRKFRRDRDKLLERGIVIREVRAAGAQETEESAWTIDHRRGTDPPLSRRRCGMECLCRALRAALFVPKRTR